MMESMKCADCVIARDMLGMIMRDFDSFTGGKALSDDATIVVFMRK